MSSEKNTTNKTIAICASGPSRNRWVEKINGVEIITTVINSCTFDDVTTIILIHKDNVELQNFIRQHHSATDIVIVNDMSYRSTWSAGCSYDNNDVIFVCGDLINLKPHNVRKYVDTKYVSAVARYSVPWGRALVSSDRKLIRRSDIGGDAVVLFGRKHISEILSDEMLEKAKNYHKLFWPNEDFDINKSNHYGIWVIYAFFFDITSSIKRKNEISDEIGSIFDEDAFYADND